MSPILLVEDDVSLACSLREFLKDQGYTSYIARTLHEAIEMVRVLRPALCLLDLNLPDGSGMDLLRCIVQEAIPVKVIVMTAFPLHHLAARYPAGTVINWLSKPVAPVRLLETVRRALGDRQLHEGSDDTIAV